MNNSISINNLTLGYDREIYSSISASSTGGELVAVVGPNGIGKSTLLRTICGLKKIFSGEIFAGEQNIGNLPQKELSKIIAYVPTKTPGHKNLTVFDMLATSCYNRTNWLGTISSAERDLILQTLNMVGLNGFDKRDSCTLSDGEFQRAAIARSLVQDSPIIILDEPTAFLDIANKALITKLLRQIAKEKKKIIIFSTHDLPLAIQMCDRIWIMGEGGFFNDSPDKLIEKGAFETMFKDSALTFDQKLLTLL